MYSDDLIGRAGWMLRIATNWITKLYVVQPCEIATIQVFFVMFTICGVIQPALCIQYVFEKHVNVDIGTHFVSYVTVTWKLLGIPCFINFRGMSLFGCGGTGE